jgi:hypothetical protein
VRRLGPILTSAAGVALVIVAFARHGSELGHALERVAIPLFALATLLHVAVVVVRCEAWRLTLAAVGGRRPPLRASHWAAALGFVAGTIEGHAALPARMGVLRRLAPTQAPSMRQMLLSDVPVYALEACLIAALLPLAAPAIEGIPAWSAALAPAAAVAALLVLRVLHERVADRPLAGGLAVLGVPGLRGRLVVLVAVIVALTLARVWILIVAAGLPHGPTDAVLVYVAVTVVGQLPIGPATGPAATIAVASGSGVAAAAAAGLAISASSIAGVLVYAAGAGVLTAPVRSKRGHSNATSP